MSEADRTAGRKRTVAEYRNRGSGDGFRNVRLAAERSQNFGAKLARYVFLTGK